MPASGTHGCLAGSVGKCAIQRDNSQQILTSPHLKRTAHSTDLCRSAFSHALLNCSGVIRRRKWLARMPRQSSCFSSAYLCTCSARESCQTGDFLAKTQVKQQNSKTHHVILTSLERPWLFHLWQWKAVQRVQQMEWLLEQPQRSRSKTRTKAVELTSSGEYSPSASCLLLRSRRALIFC